MKKKTVLDYNKSIFRLSNVDSKTYKVTDNEGKTYNIEGKTWLANGKFSVDCPEEIKNYFKKQLSDNPKYDKTGFMLQTVSMLKKVDEPVNSEKANILIVVADTSKNEQSILADYCKKYNIKSKNIELINNLSLDDKLKAAAAVIDDKIKSNNAKSKDLDR